MATRSISPIALINSLAHFRIDEAHGRRGARRDGAKLDGKVPRRFAFDPSSPAPGGHNRDDDLITLAAIDPSDESLSQMPEHRVQNADSRPFRPRSARYQPARQAQLRSLERNQFSAIDHPETADHDEARTGKGLAGISGQSRQITKPQVKAQISVMYSNGATAEAGASRKPSNSRY